MPVGAVAFIALVLTDTEDRSARTDTLVVALTGEPRSLDPHTTTSSNDFRVCQSIYQGLVRFAPGSLRIEPALARSWTISDDGLTYVFELRQDVRFHDDSRFDADAVVFNFDRMLDQDHPQHDTGPFPFSFFFESVGDVEATGEFTARFTLDEPFAPLLANLAYPTGLIVSPAAVRRHGSDYGRHPSGTGPFSFHTWQSRRMIELRRSGSFAGQPPDIARIIFRPIADPAARMAELMAGSTDLVLDSPPDLLARLRQHRDLTVTEESGTHLWFLILNCQHGPLSNHLVRQALHHAIDRRAIARQLLQDTATATVSAFPTAFDWIRDTDPPVPRPDPAKARELLGKAGHSSAELTLWLPEGGSGMLQARAMGEAIQADLARVGLTLKIEVFEWNSFLERVNGGLDDRVDMAAMAWMTNDPDTLPYLTLRRDAWPEKGGFNSGRFFDPRLDPLLEQARRTNSLGRRAELYRRADTIIREQLPWIIVASARQHAIHRPRLSGIELHPAFLLRLHQATLDSPKD